MQLQGVTGELPETPVDQDWKAIEDGLGLKQP